MVWWLALVIRSFFGWGTDKTKISESQVPQSSDTWFVNTLTNPEENETEKTTEETNTQKEYTEIKLMMPKYFYTPARKEFADDLYSWEKVSINFVFVDDLNQYRDIVSNQDFSDADIFLYPYDWNEFIKTQPFSFQKSLKPAFDDFVSDIIQDWDTTFLPFSADPMIMYILSGHTLNSFSEISKFVENRQSKRLLSFPIFYGITDEDYYDKWFSREYKDIVRYALLHYFTTYRNISNEQMLSDWIDCNNWIWTDINGFQNYNVSNLNSILSTKDTPECKHFPSVCFQLYDLVWLRFGFLSDIDIIETYFQSRKWKLTDINIENFPFSDTESPVRIWWRSIPNSLTDDIHTTNAVYRFLVKYMNSGKKYNLWSSTLPLFKTEEWNSIINNPFIWFRGYILTTWWNFVEQLKSTRAFWQLLDYEITAEEYLRKI